MLSIYAGVHSFIVACLITDTESFTQQDYIV